MPLLYLKGANRLKKGFFGKRGKPGEALCGTSKGKEEGKGRTVPEWDAATTKQGAGSRPGPVKKTAFFAQKYGKIL